MVADRSFLVEDTHAGYLGAIRSVGILLLVQHPIISVIVLSLLVVAAIALARRHLSHTKDTVKLPARVRSMYEADAANVVVSPALIEALHPWALSAFDETAEAFRFIIRELGQGKAEDEIDRRLHELATSCGLSDERLLQRLKSKQAGDIDGAEALWKRLGSLRIVKTLVLACQRYWSWGAADLFRLRITSAQGYLRLEAEAAALIALFQDDDDLAERWSSTHGDKEGSKFFRETQPRLKQVLERFDLARVYGIVSGSSQHVRMASVVRSLKSSGGILSLPDQEFDKDDPFSFHLAVAHFHRIQGRVLTSLGLLVLGGNDQWKALETGFIARSDDMWRALESTYSEEIPDADELENPKADL